VRDSALHETLEAFAADAGLQLAAEAARGAEIPFEVVEERRGRVPLYRYRPLTDAFIEQHMGRLSALPSYGDALRAVARFDGTEEYLRERGETVIPTDARGRADATLRAFLGAVFDERSEFELERGQFEAAYTALEGVIYEGRSVSVVIAPLLGLMLDPRTPQLPLGEGLSLIRGEAFPDAPADAVWDDSGEPNVLAVLASSEERSARSPVSVARSRFRRVLTALRLFAQGGYALGPIAWTRSDCGAWRSVALGGSGRPRFVTVLEAVHEDELRAFYNLLGRYAAYGGELGWALGRFEMGCERLAPFEALSDYLLALRALLEPEGPSSGRLATRLAALCATRADRPALAERVARAISLERGVIAGLAPAEPGADALVDELAEHLRALLRDVLCGHLDIDLCAVADELLIEIPQPVAAPQPQPATPSAAERELVTR
jgi:hypothetical protein